MNQDNEFKVTDRRAATDDGGATSGGGGCGCAAAGAERTAGQPVFPQVTFSTFILSLCSSAMVHLGEVPEPETGQLRPDLPLAKHTIDILAMLKDKTSKCLDADEARLLDGMLYELRLVYVMKTT